MRWLTTAEVIEGLCAVRNSEPHSLFLIVTRLMYVSIRHFTPAWFAVTMG